MKIQNGCLVLGLLLAGPLWAASDSMLVGANEKVQGKALDEYANLWWQWASSMPADQSPVRDISGLKCDVNQNGPVWFLAGGYGSSKIRRQCTIPQGHYLFFPVINMINFANKTNSKLSCEQVKANSAMNNDHLRAFEVRVDEQKWVNPVFHRASSNHCFDLLGWPAKTVPTRRVYPSATDGYWVMLKPLPVGAHVIRFKAEYHNPDSAYGLMVQDIEYQIDIVETAKPAPKFDLIRESQRIPEKSI